MNYISNLVTSKKIDKALADSIVKDRIKTTGSTAINIYVSANGSDETGTGSQEKPYKTIQHIQLNVLPYLYSANKISIVPLTDIVEDQMTDINHFLGYLLINTTYSGHTITFNNRIQVIKSKVTFSNNVFEQGLDCSEKSYVVAGNCIFKTKNLGLPAFRINYGSLAILSNNTYQSTTDGTFALRCYDYAYIHIRQNSTFIGAFLRLLDCFSNGVIYFVDSTTITTTEATGEKYSLRYDSTLNLTGRGDNIFGDHLTAGTKDESSVIC